MRAIVSGWSLLVALAAMSCARQTGSSHVPLGPAVLPAASFEKPPEEPYDRSSYAIAPRQMTSFYDVPGEYGYIVDGRAYGFEGLSFIITETHPHGGPPLHAHKTEEAHVVLSGTMEYVIGSQRFTVEAPYVARVPAGVAHTFVNAGTTPLNVIAVFPTSELDWTPIGPNPLVEK
jgi:mannose-6-phosphate isomerase-like protein (cupin superfamily)